MAVFGHPRHGRSRGVEDGEVPEGQYDAGPFLRPDAVVYGLAQELVVGRTGPLGAPGPRPVKRQLDRVQKCGLTAAVQTAEQDDG